MMTDKTVYSTIETSELERLRVGWNLADLALKAREKALADCQAQLTATEASAVAAEDERDFDETNIVPMSDEEISAIEQWPIPPMSPDRDARQREYLMNMVAIRRGGYVAGWQAARAAAVKVCDDRATAIQNELPSAHGGSFAIGYARSALLGVAALIEKLEPPALDGA